MTVQYDYDITDFLNDKIVPSVFTIEVNNSAISGTVSHINTSTLYAYIFFNSALSPGDESILDSLVTVHDGEPATRLELGPTSDHIMGYPTSLADPEPGHSLLLNETGDAWTSAHFVQNFLDLLDAPTTYSGHDGHAVTVISGASGLEFTDLSQLVTTAKIESFYASSLEVSFTTAIDFITKVELDLNPQESGYFEIKYSCIQSHADTGVTFRTRVRVDNSTNILTTAEEFYNFKYEDGAWRPRSGIYVMYLEEGAHNIKLQHSTGEFGKAAYMKEAFVIVKRLALAE